jgi:murein DD-endopeptidase MepM/ murein hydrolase activator NlpD
MLGEAAVIPVLFEGTVARIGDDFLGATVYVRHHVVEGTSLQLISAYGHVVPVDRTGPGSTVGKGEPIGTIADTARKSGMPPHLHISLAWADPGLDPARLSWDVMCRSDEVILLDPLPVIVPAASSSSLV